MDGKTNILCFPHKIENEKYLKENISKTKRLIISQNKWTNQNIW